MRQNPSNKNYKGLFLHFFSTIMLYISFYNLLNLLFNFLSLGLKQGFYNSLASMQFELAALTVAYPAYVWSCITVNKMALPTRSFFNYFTVFLGSIILICTGITLVYSLIIGDSGLGFILKVLVLMTMTMSVSYYYLGEIKQKWLLRQKFMYLVSSGLITIAALVIGYYAVLGDVKLADQDYQRTINLNTIQAEITRYYASHKKLPDSLLALENPSHPYFSVSVTDPVTKQAYGYSIVSTMVYQLCANFALPSSALASKMIMGQISKQSWPHDGGRFCFTRNVNDQS